MPITTEQQVFVKSHLSIAPRPPTRKTPCRVGKSPLSCDQTRLLLPNAASTSFGGGKILPSTLNTFVPLSTPTVINDPLRTMYASNISSQLLKPTRAVQSTDAFHKSLSVQPPIFPSITKADVVPSATQNITATEHVTNFSLTNVADRAHFQSLLNTQYAFQDQSSVPYITFSDKSTYVFALFWIE